MTYTPVDRDLDLYQGADFSYTFTVPPSGTPTNLTGYTARAKAARVVGGQVIETILSLTDVAGITLGGSAGTVALSASAAVTTELEPGQYRYDVEIVSGAGAVSRIAQGRITVHGEVTT